MKEQLLTQLNEQEEQQTEETSYEWGTYIEDETTYFQVGDVVQVKEIKSEQEDQMDPEDYYYLLGFGKKKGIVTDVKGDTVLNIYVDLDGTIGVFYEQDLKKIS